ncbi:MAG: hypothetical protein COB37_07200 [Kordiimonadales bacterium]|nr:MAG: hypothetical protein COB37_07200 [Kordiimonadales bacterium]
MDKALFYPILLQGTLTFSVLALFVRRRFKAAYAGKTDPKYFKLYQGKGEPPEVRVVDRNFSSQFEMPVLFYVVSLAAMVLDKADDVMLAAAWAYASFRVLHAYVHIYVRKIMTRFYAFMASNIALIFMWVWLAIGA